MKVRSLIIYKTLLMFSLTFTLFVSCDNFKNKPAKEKEYLTYWLFTIPTSIDDSCLPSQREALRCAGTPVNQGKYLAFLSVIYSIPNITPPADPQKICDVLAAAEEFPTPGSTNTVGGKSCVLECHHDYWSVQSATTCADFEPVLHKLFTDANTGKCVEDCFVRGTVPPF